MGKIELGVVCDHQVNQAVSVVVAESGSGRPPPVGHSRLCGYIGKSPITVVAIQDISVQAGDVDIGPAVVVVVAYRAAHGKARSRDPRLVSHIRERSVMIVVVQGASTLLVLVGHFHRRRIREINIQPAVAIVVEQQHTAAHGFGDVAVPRGRSMAETNARLLRDVLQLRDGASLTLDGLGAGRGLSGALGYALSGDVAGSG